MKMGETSTHEASHEDQDAMGQRPGAGGGTLELEAPAEALHLLRQLKILRDDDELPDGFVIDSKRMRNLHLELFEMFNIAIDKAQPLPTGKSNGTRLATAANAIATAIADHLNKSGYHAMGDTQNLDDLANSLENPDLKDTVLMSWISNHDMDLFDDITTALTERARQ